MEFFNNRNNDTIKFKLNSEGIDINRVEPRLILSTKENKNYLFFGEISGDVCRFNIPELGVYEKGDNGKIKFEIISEDLYFPVWEDKFEITTKATVKIEEMINIKTDEKPKKSISIVQPIIEKKETPEVLTKEKDKSIENKPIIKQNKIIEKQEEDSEIKNFKTFFK